jgi:hypothetical protein
MKKTCFQLDLDAAVLLEMAEEATKREEEGSDSHVGEDTGYASEETVRAGADEGRGRDTRKREMRARG